MSADGLIPSGAPRDRFTDRENAIQQYRRLLVSRQSPVPVLFFHGVAGNGKTTLQKHLRWLTQKEHPAIPTARIDFDSERHTGRLFNAAIILAMVRNALEVEVPRFDLAYAWLRRKEQATATDPTPRGAGGVGHVWDVAFGVIEALEKSAWVGGALVISRKVLEAVGIHITKTRLYDWLLEKAGQHDYVSLSKMEPEDIRADLAQRLIRDLAQWLPARGDGTCRGVVFFDGFEVLRGGLDRAQQGTREGHVRQLCEVNHRRGSPILFVVSGRDRLKWSDVDSSWSDINRLIQQPLDGFTEVDAKSFLERSGVTSGALRDAILRVSRHHDNGGSDGRITRITYHPLMLSVCVDAVEEERRQANATVATSFRLPPGDWSRLAERFLNSLSTDGDRLWIEKLAFPPRFDREAALAILTGGSPMDTRSEAAWRSLLDLSFVLEQESESGWYRLHDLMRSALTDRASSNRADIHRQWRDHWLRRLEHQPDRDFATLAWFHEVAIDEHHAVELWRSQVIAARVGQDLVAYRELFRRLTILEGDVSSHAVAAFTNEAFDKTIDAGLEPEMLALWLMRRVAGGHKESPELFKELSQVIEVAKDLDTYVRDLDSSVASMRQTMQELQDDNRAWLESVQEKESPKEKSPKEESPKESDSQ